MTAHDELQATLHQHNSGRLAPSRDAPRTLVELLAQHAAVALDVSGADQTAWNGQIVEAGEGILGLAHWDGTLHLDRECILDPLRDLYARSGDRHPPGTLARYREALLTLLHEQSHFLGPAGATQEDARRAFTLTGSRALEEGVAEAWSHSQLDTYLTRLGIDRAAPGITGLTTPPSYAAFVPAVRLLTADLDDRTGLPAGSALALLNRNTAAGQWPVVVDLTYQAHHLDARVPAADEPAVRADIERRLRGLFRSLEPLEHAPTGYAASRSHTLARETLTALDHHLSALAPTSPPPSRSTHAPTDGSPLPPTRSPHAPTDHSAVPPPTRSSLDPQSRTSLVHHPDDERELTR